MSGMLKYDPSGVFVRPSGIGRQDFLALEPELLAARDEMLGEDLELLTGPAEDIPLHKRPLDSKFHQLPQQLLDDYENDRGNSELQQILSAAAELRERVDRIVVLGIGGSYMGARALLESCCLPHYNEWSDAERGGYPRIYFAGNNLDNDATQGLLRLLSQQSKTSGKSWGLIVISKSGGTLETAVALRQFYAALQASEPDPAALAKLIIPVTGKQGRLRSWAEDIGCQTFFDVPDGVGGRFSILSAVGLLPAAMIGVDIVELLRGAVEMNQHFATEKSIETNIVCGYTGVCYQHDVLAKLSVRVLSVWSNALEAAGLWYDQLMAESLGKDGRAPTPLTTVNTRDLHSRAQQHQQGCRDKLITNLIVGKFREDGLAVGAGPNNHDQLDALQDRQLPQLLESAIRGTNDAYRFDGRPTADLVLPDTSARSMGQFFQMMMLATVLEGRLMRVNPYGQPGVENYKVNMARYNR